MSAQDPNKPDVRPFHKNYVLRTTTFRLKQVVDGSISYAFERSKTFQDDPVKAQEAFATLGALHAIRAQIDAIHKQHNIR